jgi:hypothetical protein
VGVSVRVGLAVGLGETVSVGVKAGAAWDWQAARKTSNRAEIRIYLLGKDVSRMFILITKYT